MINARSPFYITAPVTLGTTSAVKLTLKINSLTENSSLSSPNYEVTKNRPYAGTTYLDFEVSNMLKDEFVHTPIYNATTALLDSVQGNVLQLNYSLDYIGSAGDTTVLKTNVFDGYGYFNEGSNPQAPSSKILLANDYYIVNKNGFFNIPVYNDGTYPNITVNGTPYTLSTSTYINTKIKNMWLNCNGFSGSVPVVVGGKTITLEVQEECKYQPFDVMFKNKFGAWEIMTFFKASKEGLQVQKSTFKNNYVANGSYNVSKHTYQDFNKNGREKIQLNSGFVPEAYNETIRQLLLSEQVYFLNNGNHIPVNTETSSYSYKTRIIDKLISHQIDFEYSFDLINNL